MDAVTRLLPGALGNEASAHHESFTAREARNPVKDGTGEEPQSVAASGGLLDYPHYTRPAEFAGMAVPEVLLGGDHEKIRRWRREQALRKTWLNRPELLDEAALSGEDKEILARLKSGAR